MITTSPQPWRRTFICLSAITLLLFGCSSNPQSTHGVREQAIVERVIDGDTLVLELRGRRESYRLLAIDAPELSNSIHAGKQARSFNLEVSQVRKLGKRAKLRLEQILPRNSEVEIEFDSKPRDKYQRPLVYLYLPGSSRSINEQLLEEGTAWFFNPKPNNRLAKKMRDASDRSSRERRGIWASASKRD